MSRFDRAQPFAASSYQTPGWQRAQANMAAGYRTSAAPRREPMTIEGELVAKSTGTPSAYGVGDRVFHLKFGYGAVAEVDGNKLTVDFDKAGRKRVVDSFVERG
jgi:DNA helicase-2/ATP-dependent DNA helicase PcrA